MAVTLPLTTDRLLIEPMTLDDADALAAYRSDPAVARYQSWDAPFTPDAARRMLEGNPAGWPDAGDWLQLAVREAGALAGDVAVHPLDDDVQRATVEIGVTMAAAAQGRGLGTEAVRAVVGACFSGGAHRVFAACDARNEPVARLLARVGMRREARLVDAEWWKGEWTTADTWAVLDTEWRG